MQLRFRSALQCSRYNSRLQGPANIEYPGRPSAYASRPSYNLQSKLFLDYPTHVCRLRSPNLLHQLIPKISIYSNGHYPQQHQRHKFLPK